MNKLELIQTLRDRIDLSKSECAAVVVIFPNGMTETLAKGDLLRSVGCAPFTLRNMMDTLGATRKRVNESRSKRRSFHFSRQAWN